MKVIERIAADLTGVYRDAGYDRAGRLVWDSGLRKNAIVASCIMCSGTL